ncbi:MAG: hypothetical protein LBT38_06710 [Deltaproteobacteria bacterium]|jgi:YHS domain-containing protein|nr:hypothetical protein [Deltaproteobacteria bacterium]
MLFILRLLIIAFLFYLIIWVAKGLFRPTKPPLDIPKLPQDMVQDALTGVFFDKSQAFTLTTKGQTIYFCSQENRDAWLAQRRTLQ